jgi:hypothetical protein
LTQILEGGTRSGATDSAATLQVDIPSGGTESTPVIEAIASALVPLMVSMRFKRPGHP